MKMESAFVQGFDLAIRANSPKTLARSQSGVQGALFRSVKNRTFLPQPYRDVFTGGPEKRSLDPGLAPPNERATSTAHAEYRGH
jgi:hypothetical protein